MGNAHFTAQRYLGITMNCTQVLTLMQSTLTSIPIETENELPKMGYADKGVLNLKHPIFGDLVSDSREVRIK